MIPKVCAIALLSAILYAALEGLGFKSRGLFASLCFLIVLSLFGESLTELFGSFSSLADRTGISEAASCALRAVGLGYIYGFTSDICASLGEKTIGMAVTLIGRAQIFLVAFPYFEKIIALGIELLK
jgi:hypothetical protein